MDPASIAGVIGTVITIAQVVDKSVTKLNALRAKYKDADLSISTLTGQLSFIGSTLKQLERLTCNGIAHGPFAGELASKMELALDTCNFLILSLNERIDQLEKKGEGWLSVRGKVLFLWSEKGMNDYLMQLNFQINALNLLMNVIQLERPAEQQAIIQEDSTLTVLRLARESSSSLCAVGADHRSSVHSHSTEDTNGLSHEFDFDCELLGTRTYQKASKFTLRQLLDKGYMPHKGYPASIHSNTNSDRTGRIAQDFQQEDHGGEAFDLPEEAHTTSLVQDKARKSGSTPHKVSQSRRSLARDLLRNVDRVKSPEKTDPEDLFIMKKTSVEVSYNKRVDDEDLPDTHLNTPSTRITKYEPEAGLGVLDKTLTPLPQATVQQQVLLLGTSDSGKSTLLRSVELEVASDGLSSVARNNLKAQIRESVENAMMEFLAWLETLTSLDYPDWWTRSQARKVNQKDFQKQGLSEEFALTVHILWSNDRLRLLYEQRSIETAGHGLVAYWAGNILRIADDAYVPTVDDILRCQTTTLGTYRKRVAYDGIERNFIDVGGRRSERKKWAYVYEDTGLLVFTVSATSYSERLAEENSVSHWEETLALFDSIRNSLWFCNLPCLVVITKMDDLAAKLHAVPAKTVFPDYKGGDDPERFKKFIKEGLLSRIGNGTGPIRMVFTSISDVHDRPGKIVLEAAKDFMTWV